MPAKLQRQVAAPPRPAAAAGGAARPAARGSLRGRAVGTRVLVQFTTQFATLLEAGVPVLRGLQILEARLEAGAFKRVLGAIAEDVASGTPLSEAFAKHPRIFDRLFTNMVRAGEAGGVLDTILKRLGEYLERMQSIRDRAKSALLYPCVVLGIAALVLTVVFLVVIPKFEEIFQTLDTELPGPTRFLIDSSRFVVRDGWIVLLALGLVGISLRLAYLRVHGFRRFLHGRILRLPLVGRLVSRAVIARFSRTFGTLLSSGVPHLDALGIVRGSIGNEVVGEAVDHVRDRVREGEGLATPMGATGVFDELVVNMVDVGEQTGELDRMCLKVADAYDVEVNRSLEGLFKILEPLLLVGMAVVVGFIVISLFLPLLSILEKLGQ
ncbi:MAG TPA: type II secretion system F family protein [Planctomycetota bacterium]|jgi:type IV pilus assembly protein PilC|nr:type II secretion system F family protein [Planctomycetota bacterium]